MPIKSFADQTTADIARGEDTKAARRVPQRVWKVAQTRIDALHVATTLSDLARPGWRLHAFGRDEPGTLLLWINEDYRLVFRFLNGDAHYVRILHDPDQRPDGAGAAASAADPSRRHARRDAP